MHSLLFQVTFAICLDEKKHSKNLSATICLFIAEKARTKAFLLTFPDGLPILAPNNNCNSSEMALHTFNFSIWYISSRVLPKFVSISIYPGSQTPLWHFDLLSPFISSPVFMCLALGFPKTWNSAGVNFCSVCVCNSRRIIKRQIVVFIREECVI